VDARRALLRASATRTANTNATQDRTSGTGAPLAAGGGATGAYDAGSGSSRSAFDKLHKNATFDNHSRGGGGFLGPGQTWGDFGRESWKTIKDDPWLLTLPAAPFAVAGLGPAATGKSLGAQLGFGEGAGTLVGSSAPEMAYASSDSTAAEGVMNAARVPAAGATAPAAGAATTPTLGSMVGADLAKYAGPAAIAAAPYAINALMGGRTKEEKQLIAKQEQLAQEAKVRQGQQQDARMNALGQQMLAFNPTNQMMAQMFGPDAAFQPEQMAAMAQGEKPAYDEKWSNYKGTDKKTQNDINEYIRRKKEYDAAEASRRDMIMGGIQRPGPGPAPIQMPTPQAARRY
jgi:hypothetical protein